MKNTTKSSYEKNGEKIIAITTSLLLISAILGGQDIIYTKNRRSTFELNEHPVLDCITSISKDKVTSNYIIDINENNIYDMNKDILISKETNPKVQDKIKNGQNAVYLTETDGTGKKIIKILATKNDDNTYTIIEKPSDIYKEKDWFFLDNYMDMKSKFDFLYLDRSKEK